MSRHPTGWWPRIKNWRQQKGRPNDTKDADATNTHGKQDNNTGRVTELDELRAACCKAAQELGELDDAKMKAINACNDKGYLEKRIKEMGDQLIANGVKLWQTSH